MDKEYYQGTKTEGYITIPNNVARSTAFCKWVGTKPAALYFYLLIKRNNQGVDIK